MRYLMNGLIATLCLGLSGCGYNTIQTQDEAIKAAWSEVVNQYQRRADLIPNLVNTVKGYAAQEQAVFIGVAEARSRATSIQLTPEMLNDPEALKKFQAAQGELTNALKSLIAVSERYPDLKSDQNFRDLQAQLEGTENRISVERMRYNDKAREYNTARQRFPTALFANLLGFHEKGYFKAQPDAATAPKVNFDFSPAPGLPAGSPAARPPAPSARP